MTHIAPAPVTLKNLYHHSKYYRLDNRKPKIYCGLLEYIVTLEGEGLDSLLENGLLGLFQDELGLKVQLTLNGNDERGGVRIKASYAAHVPKPSRIPSEAVLLADTKELLEFLTNEDNYWPHIVALNNRRAKVAESYAPVFDTVRQKIEEAEENLIQFSKEFGKVILEDSTEICRTLEWRMGDCISHDRAKSEWRKVHRSLENGFLRGKNLPETLSQEIDSRIEDLYYESTHNSTCILSNAFNYTEAKTKRGVLKALSFILQKVRYQMSPTTQQPSSPTLTGNSCLGS